MDIVKVSLDSFPGIRIGQTENKAGGTGITVLLCEDPEGMRAGLHIGGGGPAARETGILNPVATAQRIHAAVLGGGSAFGLDAAGGVMRYLEKKGFGVEVRDIHIPLVTQVDIFDLPVGDPRVRPDQEMGYAACQMAEAGKRGNFRSGNYGAGCGATVGKYAGGDHAMKGGIGSCVLRQGRLMVGAIVAVNAFGDIYNWKTGQKIAGARTDDGRLYGMEDMVSFLRKNEASRIQDAPAAETALNTTIGIVFTNASLSKAELCKMAAMAHDGFARSISPIHTSGDGDSIIALSVTRGGSHHFEVIDAGCDTESTGEIPAGIDTVGTLAAWAVSEAILDGVQNAETAYGYPAMSDLHKTRIFPE